MALVVSLSIAQSITGETLLISDTSNYTSQGINVANVSRSITVQDANGSTIATLTFPAGSTNLTLNYPITKDGYYTFVANFTYQTVLYTSTRTYYATNFYQYAQAVYMSKRDCGCTGGKAYVISDNVTKAREAWYGGTTLFLAGQGPAAQSAIDDANTLINTAK